MKLVDEAHQAWRWWSVRLALIFGPIFGALVDSLLQQPRILTEMAGYAPEQWRTLASVIAGVLATLLPILARLVKQEGKANGG